MPKTQLVLLPGLLCDSTVWIQQCEALNPLADSTVADYGALNTLPAMAEHVLATAPETFAVAGHSMGARIALEIYRRAPERVHHLALFDSRYQALPAGPEGEQEAAGRYALLEIARTQGMRAMAQRWVQGMVHPDRLSDEKLISTIIEMMARKTPEIFDAQIHALLNRPDASDLLKQISCPTLVLCGAQDAWSTLPWHEEMARLIPGAKLAAIEKAGHMVTLEQPDQVSAAMRNWLA